MREDAWGKVAAMIVLILFGLLTWGFTKAHPCEDEEPECRYVYVCDGQGQCQNLWVCE